MFNVHQETMSRVVNWLIKEELVRLVGSAVGYPYEIFGGGKGNGKTLFYSPTKVRYPKKTPGISRWGAPILC